MGKIDFLGKSNNFSRHGSSYLRLTITDANINIANCDCSLSPEGLPSSDCKIKYTPNPNRTYVSTFIPDNFGNVTFGYGPTFNFRKPGFGTTYTIDSYDSFPDTISQRYLVDKVVPDILKIYFEDFDEYCRLSGSNYINLGSDSFNIEDLDGGDSIDHWSGVESAQLRVSSDFGSGSLASPTGPKSHSVSVEYTHTVTFKPVYTDTSSGLNNNRFIATVIFSYNHNELAQLDWKSYEYFSSNLTLQSTSSFIDQYTSNGAGGSFGFYLRQNTGFSPTPPSTIKVVRK